MTKNEIFAEMKALNKAITELHIRKNKTKAAIASYIEQILRNNPAGIWCADIARHIGCRPCEVPKYIYYNANNHCTIRREEPRTQRFAEVDENGELIPDGNTHTITAERVKYIRINRE